MTEGGIFWIQQAGRSTKKFEKTTISEKFNELVTNVDQYLDGVSQYVADKRISDETCQTYSELQTTPESKNKLIINLILKTVFSI